MRLTKVLGLACLVMVVAFAPLDPSAALQDSLGLGSGKHHAAAERPDNPWRRSPCDGVDATQCP